MSDRHRFLLKQIHSHMKWLEDRIREINRRQVVAAGYEAVSRGMAPVADHSRNR